MKIKFRERRRNARELRVARFKAYRRKIRSASKIKKISEEDCRLICALAGVGGRPEALLWSDSKAVRFASLCLTLAMLEVQKTNPNTRFFLITLLDDVGTVSDRTPLVPIQTLTTKARRAITKIGLDAVGVVEVHPLMNYPGGGDGRSLLFHVHAIGWTEGELDHQAAAATLNASSAWRCKLGAKPVDIRPIGLTKRDLGLAAGYLFKPTYVAKNRMPDKRRLGQFIMMDTTEGLRGDMALRVLEGCSQVDLTRIVFGLGKGAAVRQQLRHELEAWHGKRPKDADTIPANTDIWRWWLEFRKRTGSTNYLPYRFDELAPPKPERVPAVKKAALLKSKRGSRPATRKPRWILKSSLERRKRRPKQGL